MGRPPQILPPCFNQLQRRRLQNLDSLITAGINTCKFLGQVVVKGCITPQQTETKAVEQFKHPRSKTDITVFFSHMGNYRKFILIFSSRAALVTDLTTPKCNNAFTVLKKVLTNDPVLQAPDYDLLIILHRDVSCSGISTVQAKTGCTGLEHPAYYL